MATAVVTGATAGIGAEFARVLHARGHEVVLVARDRERLAARARELGGDRVEVLPADLTDRGGLEQVAARLADPAAPVDVLVNNAGFGIGHRFVGGEVTAEQHLIDLLVTATMRLTHAVLPGMVTRGRGAVVTVSSMAGWVPGGTYSAAKAWQTVFSESLARELVGTGVQVTALAPGYTRTEFHTRAGIDMSALPDWLWLDPREVVATGLRDVARGRAVSVPGRQYKLLAVAAQYLPRPLIRFASGGAARMGVGRRRPR